MKAAQIEVFGSPLRVGEVAEPTVEVGHIAVSLTHAGVNPIDVRMCAGGAGRIALPFIPGCDGVGIAEGRAVIVYGSGIGLKNAGTYAAQVGAPPASVFPIPTGIDPVQAAGLGLAAVAAWGLVHGGDPVTAEDRVLVLGGSGGVGTLVVQLARATGARVWSQTTKFADVEMQQRLGAEEVVVCHPGDLAEAARRLAPTIVIDGLGGAYTGAAVELLASGGRLLVFGAGAGQKGEVDLATLYRKAINIRGYAALTTADHVVKEAIDSCLRLMAAGQLRAHVDAVMPLDEVNEAHRRMTHREITGKLVLAVRT